MWKKNLGFAALAFSLLFTSPNLSHADELSHPKEGLTKAEYSKFVRNGAVDKSVSYNTWVNANANDSFEAMEKEFPVPDKLMEVKDTSVNDVKTYKGSSLSSATATKASSKGPVLKKGDVLVSNATSSYGLTGHAGIAISSNEVLHISGSGAHPKVISTKTWQDRYGIVKGQKEGLNIKTNVYRIKSTKNASKAASWTVKNYKGKKYNYMVTNSLGKKDPTYCSKIVYQAYSSIKAVNYPPGGFATPYGLPNYFKKAQKLKGMGYL